MRRLTLGKSPILDDSLQCSEKNIVIPQDNYEDFRENTSREESAEQEHQEAGLFQGALTQSKTLKQLSDRLQKDLK